MGPNLLHSSLIDYCIPTAKESENTRCSASSEAYRSLKTKREEVVGSKEQNNPKYEWKCIRWYHLISIALLHVFGAYAFFTAPYLTHWRTSLWMYFVASVTGFGITAGAHRLWTHRSYKANTAVRILFMLGFSATGMNTIYQWVRDHRVHHKYSETDADPHNSKRGFFFSHVGWLMLKKHPDVIAKGRSIDMSDVTSDPVVAFHEKYIVLLRLITTWFSIATPVYLWNEDWYHSAMFQLVRMVYVLNVTWSVNSFAHIYGSKPYNKKIDPVENKYVSYATYGEGWHNYHHTFPWDYRAAELGGGRFNLTTALIDLFAKFGWVHDLKETPERLVQKFANDRGDGSRDSKDR